MQCCKKAACSHQQGFTLIEIMLVIVIMTVVTAMVVPSFFQSLGVDATTEARALHKTLRLASNEAQLMGKPIRCSVWPDRLRFFEPGNGRWQALDSNILASYVLGEGMLIREASLDASDGLDSALESIDQAWQRQREDEDASSAETPVFSEDKTQAPLADFLFWPDGSVTSGYLDVGDQEGNALRRIQIQPGPGGIRLLPEDG